MDIIQFFEKHRMEYLKAMQIVLSRTNNIDDYEPIVEAIDQLQNVEEKENNLFPFFRYDILVKNRDNGNYNEIKVNVNPIRFAQPVMLRKNEMEILIESFVWNACAIRFPGYQFNPNLLVGWYTKWIKPEQNEIGINVQEAIHGITLPEEAENKNVVLIDFGSIPTFGVLELFDIFSNTRITKLAITSSRRSGWFNNYFNSQ